MEFKFKAFGLGALCVAALALPVWAHHSHTSYETKDFTVLEGTIKEVHFLNPHSWIYLEVKEDGAAVQWVLEGDDVVHLTQAGIKKGDVRPGDAVKVRCYKARDGVRNCLLKYLTPMHGDVARGHGVEQDWD